MKIFLLEDDYALHKAIKNILLGDNYEVESFYDGELAFNNIGASFDLYLLDINVPNTDGLEITKRIKSSNPNARVIIMSANCDITTIKEGYLCGCNDYLKKPFDIEELLIKVNKLLPQDEIKYIQLTNEIKYDCNNKALLYYDTKIELTKKELSLLHLLVSNLGTTISYEQIIALLYPNEASDINALRSLVKRLRKKLPEILIEKEAMKGYFIKRFIE